MSTPVGHEAAETPNLAELAASEVHPEEVLPPILAVLPRIPRAGVLISQAVPDPIPHVETIVIEAVPEKDLPEKDLRAEVSPTPAPVAIPQADIVSPKPAPDLALDLVLNEIVLQARLTTNATGAVLGLARSGELVCRATTGATAPNVAVCLNAKSGIAATCFSTGASRRVDDLGPDPNADAVAYRASGVRSILVVPVQGETGPVLGILEIFSPRANAFCDRDVLTLQALARRIATNIELIQKSFDQGNYSPVNAEPRYSSASEHRNSKTDTLQRSKRKPRRPHIAQLWSLTSAQRSRLALLDWISILAKSAIVLILIAGSMSVRSCWQRNGDAKFIQLIREPMSHPAPAPVQHRESDAAAPLALSPQHSSPDPSAWPSITPARPGIGPSVTIQRVPVHPAKPEVAVEKSAATPDPHGDIVLFDNHKTVSKHIGQQALPSKDPAASVLPNKTGDAGPDVIPTRAAMARLVQRIEPEYPNAARQQHIQGTVLMDVVVNATGSVEALSLVSGESQLMAAAEQAVRQWKFQPLVKGGKAERFESRIAIDFTLAFEGSSGNH
jgi:TonB family protein